MKQWLVRRGLLATLPVASLVLAFGACSSEVGGPGEEPESTGATDPLSTGQELIATPRASDRLARLSAQFNRVPKVLKTAPQKVPPGIVAPKPVAAAPTLDSTPV